LQEVSAKNILPFGFGKHLFFEFFAKNFNNYVFDKPSIMYVHIIVRSATKVEKTCKVHSLLIPRVFIAFLSILCGVSFAILMEYYE